MGDSFLKRLLQFTMSENITGLLKVTKNTTISNDTHSEFRDWKYTFNQCIQKTPASILKWDQRFNRTLLKQIKFNK